MENDKASQKPNFAEVITSASNRAKCRLCLKQIPKGVKKMLFYETNFVFGRTSEKSLCLTCSKVMLQELINQLDFKV